MSTPTLKPGVLTLGDLFGGTFATYKAKFWLFLTLALAPTAAVAVLFGVLGGAGALVFRDSPDSAAVVGAAIVFGLVGLVGAFLIALLQYRCQAMTSLATRDLAAGYEPAWPDLWQRTKGFLGRFLPVALAFAGAVVALYLVLALLVVVPIIQLSRTGAEPDSAAMGGMIGTFLIVFVLFLGVAVFAVFLTVRWLYFIPVMGVEQAKGFEALSRSWQLTRGVFWPTLAHYLLMALAVSVPVYLVSMVSQFATIPFAMAENSGNSLSGAGVAAMVFASLLQLAVSAVVMPFSMIFISVMYLSRLRDLAGEPPSMAFQQRAWAQQPPYGQQAPYGQQPPYGQEPYGQQAPYGQEPYGQRETDRPVDGSDPSR